MPDVQILSPSGRLPFHFVVGFHLLYAIKALISSFPLGNLNLSEFAWFLIKTACCSCSCLASPGWVWSWGAGVWRDTDPQPLKLLQTQLGHFNVSQENWSLGLFASKSHLLLPCLGAQRWRIRLPIQETQETRVRSLGGGVPLKQEMATHSSIAWRFPWTEEPDGL